MSEDRPKYKTQLPKSVEMTLQNWQNERDAMIPRLRFIETQLIQHGVISRRTVVSRGECGKQ